MTPPYDPRVVEVAATKLYLLTKYANEWLALKRYESPMASLLWIGVICATAIAVINGVWYMQAKRDNQHYKSIIARLIVENDELKGGRKPYDMGHPIPIGPETVVHFRKILRLAVDPQYNLDNPDLVTEYSLLISGEEKSFSAIVPIDSDKSVRVGYTASYCRYLIEFLLSRANFVPAPSAEWFERNSIMPWEKG